MCEGRRIDLGYKNKMEEKVALSDYVRIWLGASIPDIHDKSTKHSLVSTLHYSASAFVTEYTSA